MKEIPNGTDTTGKEPQATCPPPMKTCPFCGEQILAIAKKCKYCGEWMDEEPQTSSYRHTQQDVQTDTEVKKGKYNYSKFHTAAAIGAFLSAASIKSSFLSHNSIPKLISSITGVDESFVSAIFDTIGSLIMIFMWYGLAKYLSELKIQKHSFNTLAGIECAIIPFSLLFYAANNGSIDDGAAMMYFFIFYIVFIGGIVYYLCTMYNAGKMLERLHEEKLGQVLRYYSIGVPCIFILFIAAEATGSEKFSSLTDIAELLLDLYLYHGFYMFFKAKAKVAAPENK